MPKQPTHECPAIGCTIHVPQSQLACRAHWFSLPAEVRSRLWSAYRRNDADSHARALEDCLAFFRAEADAMPAKLPEGAEFQPSLADAADLTHARNR